MSLGRQSVQISSEKLAVEARDSSGTQRKRNHRRWKPLPNSELKTMTVNVYLCVIMICEVQSRVV